jgi:hypothetical protein
VALQTDVDMDPTDDGVEDTNKGNGTKDAPKTKPTDQPPQSPLNTGRKIQNQSTCPSMWKNKKAQNKPIIYTIKNDVMERISYRLRDSTK